MKKNVAVLAGDGIGPEVMVEALKVLDRVSEVYGHEFNFVEALIGGAAYDMYGEHFPEETRNIAGNADAILFGSVGGHVDKQLEEKWKGAEKNAILAVRKAFGFNVNLRPVKLFKSLQGLSVLKPAIVERGIDILCVREISSGIYFGDHESFEIDGEKAARDEMFYKESEVRSVAKFAFEAAKLRNGKVASVDKANVLDCGKLWREVVTEVSEDYPEVIVENVLVDNCAMQLLKRPFDFDVLLMPNMFGDILSDLASVYSGSLGMLPSASLNSEGFGLYEPSGGSAPDIAGKGVANPVAQILSAALMLKHSFGLEKEYQVVVTAVEKTLESGVFTGDLIGAGKTNINPVLTSEMGAAILKNIS